MMLKSEGKSIACILLIIFLNMSLDKIELPGCNSSLSSSRTKTNPQNLPFLRVSEVLNKFDPEVKIFPDLLQYENYWRNNPHVPDSEYYSHEN